MKVALVHDYLIQDGGAERVLLVLHEIWPDAPIFTLYHDPKRVGPAFDGMDIRPSILQKMPFALRHYKWTLPLMPAATEYYDLSGFDVVISSTSAFAKGVITRPDTLHICYCHTPTRYLWTDTQEYVASLRLGPLMRRFVLSFLSRLRVWDRLAADRVDRFVANSETVAERIRKYYRRDSVVIHPPVETRRLSPTGLPGEYYLAGGRLVPYKRIDLVVEAFNNLGLPLRVFGEGPELEKLKASAKPNIIFVGKVSEKEKSELYRNAIAYIHPQEEDFGITAVEAMAAGRPVIAYRRGGATETVVDGETGEFFDEQSADALARAVRRLRPADFDHTVIRRHAEKFSKEIFVAKMKEFVETSWREYPRHSPDAAKEEVVRAVVNGISL